MLKRFVLPLVIIGALAALAVACNDSDSTSVETKTPEGTPISTAPPLATAISTEGTPSMPFSQACQKTTQKQFTGPDWLIDKSKTYVATIKTTKGDIVVTLNNNHPITTNNFVFLACKGFYDLLNFHRVEAGFVIQGGDPLGDGSGGPGYSIKGEFDGSKFVTGVIGMARTQDPDSAGSQFYIMLGDGPNLDGAYADFGSVTSGMDVVNQIAVGDTINEITVQEQ